MGIGPAAGQGGATCLALAGPLWHPRSRSSCPSRGGRHPLRSLPPRPYLLRRPPRWCPCAPSLPRLPPASLPGQPPLDRRSPGRHCLGRRPRRLPPCVRRLPGRPVPSSCRVVSPHGGCHCAGSPCLRGVARGPRLPPRMPRGPPARPLFRRSRVPPCLGRPAGPLPLSFRRG